MTFKRGDRITEFGFVFGPVEVQRLFGEKDGSVFLRLRTHRDFMDVRVTPKGLIRPNQPSSLRRKDSARQAKSNDRLMRKHRPA